MSRLIRNIIITLCVSTFWLSWIYYVAPQLNSKNTDYDSGICVSVESKTSWHGRSGAHTTYFILQLDTGNRYYVSEQFFNKSLHEKANDGSTLQISYYKDRHKLTYDAKEAVEIQVGKDVYLTLDESNRDNRNTRIFGWAFCGFVLSIVLYISIIQIEKTKREAFIKLVLDEKEKNSFLEEFSVYIKSLKCYHKVEDPMSVQYYFGRRGLTLDCYVVIDVDMLRENEFNDVKQQICKMLKKKGGIFANIIYILSVEVSSTCFKKVTRNYIKQHFNRKTYYIGIVGSTNTLFLPNSKNRCVRRVKRLVKKR